jgi:divalent metal cation (Fe/Co/Zn/Cd) transporter
MTSTHVSSERLRRPAAAGRARRLAYVTIGWTGLEAVVAVWAAAAAGSVALLGYGVDSAIEVFSGAVVLWRFAGGGGDSRERRAAQAVGWSLLALGVFVTVDGLRSLVHREAPSISVVGIILTGASVVIMPALARAKRRVASAVGSVALAGDARQSDLCAWLSAIVLAGLLLRAASGWWWVDAVAGLALVPIIVREAALVLRAGSLADSCCRPAETEQRPAVIR